MILERGLVPQTGAIAPASPTPYPIRGFRCLRLALHLLWICLGAAVVYPCVGETRRASLKRRWSRQILRILAVRVDAEPIDSPAGCLIAANHISWLDIFAINALRPASFVSKADILQWPLIGWLGARNDTIFLRRGSRGHARTVNVEIDRRLTAGKDVALFPEGTTTDGTSLLGFHAALLQPAVETGRPVLPMAISYHDAEGELSLAPSFAGETTMKECFLAILACRSLTVRMSAAPALDSIGKTRRELSHEAHAAIATMLASRRGFRPASSPPGI
jgi:1-acyl-sn-glycerol-3-phosphate acyltransferase